MKNRSAKESNALLKKITLIAIIIMSIFSSLRIFGLIELFVMCFSTSAIGLFYLISYCRLSNGRHKKNIIGITMLIALIVITFGAGVKSLLK